MSLLADIPNCQGHAPDSYSHAPWKEYLQRIEEHDDSREQHERLDSVLDRPDAAGPPDARSRRDGHGTDGITLLQKRQRGGRAEREPVGHEMQKGAHNPSVEPAQAGVEIREILFDEEFPHDSDDPFSEPPVAHLIRVRRSFANHQRITAELLRYLVHGLRRVLADAVHGDDIGT